VAIDGHDLTGGDLVQGGNPIQQARLKLSGPDRSQNPVEAIVRGDAGLQIERLRQPLAILPTIIGDGNDV
jgi:hypothetical protein